jgi:DNA-binding transcriptional LysR family regulator
LHNENWDDLRYILAVAETGSVLQAAKRLGVNHATVLRHVAAFEARNDTSLFERTAQGYRLRQDRVHVIEAAQKAEAAVREVERVASGGRTSMTGAIRITSTDTLCAMILPAFVVQLSFSEQAFDITLLNSNAHIDLIREQAHLVVRPSAKLAEDLVGNAVCNLGFAAYASDENATDWHALTGLLSRSVAAKWIAKEVPRNRTTSACDSFLTLRELAALGQGIAVLPCFVGEADPRLVRLPKAMPRLSVPLWVGTHVDTVVSRPQKVVQTRLEGYLASKEDLLLTGHTMG